MSLVVRSAASVILLMLMMSSAVESAAAGEPRTVGSIERFDPALEKLVDPAARMEVIGDGYAWSEGCVWVPAGNFLLFSDIPNNAIIRWDAQDGARLYLKPAGYTGNDARGGESGSNGLVLDRQDKLILCQHGDRRIARLDTNWDKPEAKYTTLADRYEGKRLNSPNDAVVDSKGNIYFTDPPYGLVKGMEDPKKELDFQGIYRIGIDGKLTLLTKEMERPNGIAISPDEKTLYVANSYDRRHVIMAFPLSADGKLGKGRVFYDANKAGDSRPGACDGMVLDKDGNLFATIPGGVGVFTPDGKQLGLIATGDRTANVDFGEDGSTLFICANHQVLKMNTRTKGLGY